MVLTHSQSNLENVTHFVLRNGKMGIEGWDPTSTESGVNFEVNDKGAIRFGLGSSKEPGEAAVVSIIEERHAHGRTAIFLTCNPSMHAK